MFDPALRQLIWFQSRAAFRQGWRRVKTPGGALLTLVLLVCVGFAVIPSIAMAFLNPSIFESSTPSVFPSFMPLMMFVIASQMVASETGKKLMELRPPELQFVLAGPFTHSQILSYRLTTMAISWSILSAFFSLVSLPYVENGLSAYLGILLGGAFVFSLSFLRALLIPRWSPQANRWVLVGLRSALVALILEAAFLISRHPDWLSHDGVLLLIDSSYLATWFAFPFTPFSYLLFGAINGAMIANALIGTLMVVGSVACCYRLNDGFSELAVEGVARRQERLSRISDGNVYARKPKHIERKRGLPMLGWWGGIGPVAWSQMTITWRRTGTLLTWLIAAALVTAVALAIGMRTGSLRLESNSRLIFFLVAMIAASYLGFIVSMITQSGFSIKQSLLTWYQTLPIRSVPLAIGMAMGSVGLMFAIRMSAAAIGWAVTNQSFADTVAILVGFIVIDIAIASVLNSVAAATPLRITTAGTPDIFQGARAMVFMLAATIVMIPIGLAAGLGALIGGLWWGFAIVPCVLSAAMVVLATMPVLWWITGNRFQNRELPAC
ncbi:putative ABC exporter domain-containing protein [Neorhodopirellula pilleata]|uniref:Uncharacterized protein n=1 Tax=Neorhodopirellula pilleata TaxID=2714738 RepID=A0A5C6AHZ4_9BACT|nr:putative ABC exporter domain-containing protein [Neorhodopirellula pilleata]TWT99030.1 hypothetical protein Pla100_22040 [Neorhodopirellula pilleata]